MSFGYQVLGFGAFPNRTVADPVVTAFTHTATIEPNATNFSFSSVDIGDAAADRKLILNAATSGVNATNRIIGATVNGAQMILINDSGLAGEGQSAQFELDFREGTSATVIVQCSGAKGYIAMGLFAVTGAAANLTTANVAYDIASLASSGADDSSIANATDGNSGTQWSEGTAAPSAGETFTITFNTAKHIRKLKQQVASGNNVATGQKLQYYDGSSFQDAGAFTMVANNQLQSFDFAESASATIWRLITTTAVGNPYSWAINQLELFEAPYGVAFDRTYADFKNENDDTTPDRTISTPAKGNIIGIAQGVGVNNLTTTWANVTERYDAVADSGGSVVSGCSLDFETAQDDLAVGATFSSTPTTATMCLVAYGPTPTAAPIVCNFLQSAGVTTTAAVKTYSSVKLGTASAGRYIIVAAGTTGGGGGSDDINSVTVGGTALTNTNVTALHTDHTLIEFWAGIIESGTSGDIVVTYARTAKRAGIAVWEATGIGTILDSGSANVTNSTNLMSDTINVAAGGLVLGYAFHADGNTITTTWEPTLTENFEANINTGGDHSAATATFASAHTALPFGAKGDSAPDYGLTVFASWNPA